MYPFPFILTDLSFRSLQVLVVIQLLRLTVMVNESGLDGSAVNDYGEENIISIVTIYFYSEIEVFTQISHICHKPCFLQ